MTMVIPSYWARESHLGWQEEDIIYDHPTPLDNQGTLLRALQSIEVLKDTDFRLVILSAATAPDIETQVEEKIAGIIKLASAKIGINVSLFGPSHLNQIHNLLISQGKNDYIDLLKLQGYSNIRNLCLFIPHIFSSEITILIDDDEIFEDPEFILKAQEFIGNNIRGTTINAVAGYYLQPSGDYRLKRTFAPWQKTWGQYDAMNEAFDKVIGSEPRLKETPFVFGGNMVIHRDLFTAVPFDPCVPRGEDIDFLINARMFGFTFFLDNRLSIKHLPVPKTYPAWMQLRQDIYRFIYERAKIENQKETEGMTMVYPESFDPYPGCFLKPDIADKIKKSCQLLSEEYLSQDDRKSAEEALKNIVLAETDAAPKHDPFQHLRRIQRRWETLMQYTSRKEVRSKVRRIIEL
ncbi:hypothetical protein ACFLVM_01955 [Chloroflexota bacterium]